MTSSGTGECGVSIMEAYGARRNCDFCTRPQLPGLNKIENICVVGGEIENEGWSMGVPR